MDPRDLPDTLSAWDDDVYGYVELVGPTIIIARLATHETDDPGQRITELLEGFRTQEYWDDFDRMIVMAVPEHMDREQSVDDSAVYDAIRASEWESNQAELYALASINL